MRKAMPTHRRAPLPSSPAAEAEQQTCRRRAPDTGIPCHLRPDDRRECGQYQERQPPPSPGRERERVQQTERRCDDQPAGSRLHAYGSAIPKRRRMAKNSGNA